MAFSKKVTFQITADDKASSKIKGVGNSFKQAEQGATSLGKSSAAVGTAVKALTGTIIALVGATALMGKKSVENSMKLENALMGLTTVARAFNVSQEDAKKAAISLAEDGLMTVTEAATGLKNLLASRFNLDEAIRLMNGFKDSAAFNRQASLGFGEAIAGATEGIKNQNSILVDNAGITKNLSIILKEAGYSIQDLGNVTTDAGVRQALFNGLIKEASIFQGDAGRAAQTLTGSISMLGTAWFNLTAAVGDAIRQNTGLQQSFGFLAEFIKIHSADISNAVTTAINWIKEQFRGWIEQMGGAEAAKEKLMDKAKKLYNLLVNEVIPALREWWRVMHDYIIPAVGWVIGKIIDLLDTLSRFKKSVNEAMESLGTFGDALKSIYKLSNPFTNITGWISEVIKITEKAISAVKKLLNLKSKSSNDDDDERAVGGPVSSGKTYLVGERGPELFTPNSSGTIIPNHQLSGGGSTFNFTFNGDISDKDQLISTIKQAINRELELSRYGIG